MSAAGLRLLAPAALAAIALRPAIAHAQPAEPGLAWPLGATQRPLTLAPGLCEATFVLESNLAVRSQFEPWSLAPDIHCGIVARLTLGVTHSARSLSLVDSGDGLCLSGEDTGCPHLYDNTAFDALAPIRSGSAALAARARLVFSSYDPVKPSLRLGGLIRLRAGRTALLLDPQFQLGIANRDRGNRDQLNLPVRGQVQLGSRVVLALQTGIRGELATFGDAFAVPIGGGVEVSPAAAWDVGLEAAFPRLLGPQNTFKERDLAVYVTYRVSITAPFRGAARRTR